jgi:hypothetical protein
MNGFQRPPAFGGVQGQSPWPCFVRVCTSGRQYKARSPEVMLLLKRRVFLILA